jgi:glycoside hydrolase-like protein
VLAGVVVAGLALAGMTPAQAAPEKRSTPLKQVTYRGYRFEVPRSWPVISNAQHPGSCVRFDLHAVYLGVPGTNQNCPSWLVGTTEALLIQPGPSAARRQSTENPVANEITATAPRISLTATFDTDPTIVYRILASAGLAAPVIVAANPARLAASFSDAGSAGAGTQPEAAAGHGAVADTVAARRTDARPNVVFGATAPELPASVANDVGLGFDVCAAPSSSYMRAWWGDSPYQAVGIYIGGADRACDQQNLTAGWVREEAADGWRFMPTYVGPQASFGQLSDPSRQGVAAAADAVAQAQRLGFGPQTPIYYDMEAYSPAQEQAVLLFITAWTRELHALRYMSGVYSSSSSGIADLSSQYHSARYAMPDVIYDALWNGAQNVGDSAYQPGEWAGRRRLHQFSGNVLQTYGGDTMDIDQDYLDLALTAAGGTTQSTPGATADNSSAVFYEGPGHHLWTESRMASGAWWRTDLGGDLTSAPTVVQTGGGGLAVLYRGRTGELTAVRKIGGRWQAPQVLPSMGIIGSAPRAVAQPNGVIDVFWSGAYDRHLWHGEFNPGEGWTGPQPLLGSLASWPYPIESPSGVVQVFWKGTDGHLWRVVRNVGAPWTRPQDLGMGPMDGAPLAIELPDGETDVFWRGLAPHHIWSAVITRRQRVLGPSDLGGRLVGSPWPVVAAGSDAVLFRGPRGQLWELRRTGVKWSSAERIGLVHGLDSGPYAASGGASSPLQLFWTGLDGKLWTERYTSQTGWEQPVDLGGRVQ